MEYHQEQLSFKRSGLNIEEALKLLTQDDIAELCLTKGQNKLLAKAVIGLSAPDLTRKPADTKPITATSLAEDQGLDKFLTKLDDSGGLDILLSSRGGGGGTPYNGLYGEAPPERGTFFRLQVYERVGISQVEVYKRVGKSVI